METMKAIYNGQVIADSDATVVVEGNHYFPADTIKQEFFSDSDTTTHCPWKGEASYYNVEIGGDLNKDAAWYYSDPKSAAEEIRDGVAFWRGVEVGE